MMVMKKVVYLLKEMHASDSVILVKTIIVESINVYQ
jgi:hypothetical protein